MLCGCISWKKIRIRAPGGGRNSEIKVQIQSHEPWERSGSFMSLCVVFVTSSSFYVVKAEKGDKIVLPMLPFFMTVEFDKNI